ncbi:hypothetical protein [Dysgonomonas termitidis]|uniref:RHS repeat-associated core domain-containing protein n=1 Tax=Dysgonomonas termitidis TaxID=1516126 RepID=A0ABV9L2U5_9BACT
MKAKVLTLIIAFLFLSASLFSQSNAGRDTKISKDGNGYTTKESIQYQRTKAVSKIVYLYDPADRLIERMSYISEYGAKWIPVQKYKYEYTADGKIANIICTKWIQGQNVWAGKSQCIAHSYGNKGVIVRQITIDTKDFNLLTMNK